MTNYYRLKIEASYPKTKYEIFTQCELDDCFTDVDKYGVESEVVNNREYIYYTGYAEGSIIVERMAQNIINQARDILEQQLRDMSDEPQSPELLKELKIRISLIDLEDWTEFGDKEI